MDEPAVHLKILETVDLIQSPIAATRAAHGIAVRASRHPASQLGLRKVAMKGLRQ